MQTRTKSRAKADAKPALATVKSIRAHFPALTRKHNGIPVAYFDGPGGTQVPRGVMDAITDYLRNHNANTHWFYPTSLETDAMISKSRAAMADFLNASPREVVFGNNMTTLTFHVSRALGRKWGPGDEIVVTELDHQANVAPWRALAKERRVTVRCVPFIPETGELSLDELERAVNSKTKLVAIGAASNAIGTISPVREAAKIAHAKGALCFVDAVHYAAHHAIDVKSMDCDFLACSPYKFYGPHAGVLYGRAELLTKLDPPKLDPAPDYIPDRLETGTQNHEGMAGVGAAVEFLASLATGKTRRERLVNAMTCLHRRGDELVARLWSGLSAIKGIRCYGPPPGRPRTPTISFTIDGVTSEDASKILARSAVFVSNGHFYATTVIDKLGQSKAGVIRAGCSCYTTEEEVDRLLEGVKRLTKRKI